MAALQAAALPLGYTRASFKKTCTKKQRLPKGSGYYLKAHS
jgi:hypothetical protein